MCEVGVTELRVEAVLKQCLADECGGQRSAPLKANAQSFKREFVAKELSTKSISSSNFHFGIESMTKSGIHWRSVPHESEKERK